VQLLQFCISLTLPSFVSLLSPIVSKVQHRSIYNHAKGKQCCIYQVLQISIHSYIYIFCYWSWCKKHCSAILQIIEHIWLSLITWSSNYMNIASKMLWDSSSYLHNCNVTVKQSWHNNAITRDTISMKHIYSNLETKLQTFFLFSENLRAWNM